MEGEVFYVATHVKRAKHLDALIDLHVTLISQRHRYLLSLPVSVESFTLGFSFVAVSVKHVAEFLLVKLILQRKHQKGGWFFLK